MTCPDYSNLMQSDGGCWVCPVCGFSACDCSSRNGLPNGMKQEDYLPNE
jgi:hypothetical protein